MLDFGRPAATSGGLVYGTIDYKDGGGEFVNLTQITAAVEAYADGYWNCSPSHTASYLTIGLATNNSCMDPTIGCSELPDFYSAGQWWQFIEHTVDEHIIAKGRNGQEWVEGGGDWEPGFDPEYTNTLAFLQGYNYRVPPTYIAYSMIDFGSLDPGFWSQDQEYYAATSGYSGPAMPEIYVSPQPQQWHDLSAYVRSKGDWLIIEGPTTTPGVGYYTPQQAFDTLLAKLQSDPVTYTDFDHITQVIWGLA